MKRASFVSVVGDTTYETLLGLVAPLEPPKVDYDVLMKLLDDYYTPANTEFYDCAKQDSETMTTLH